MKGEQRNGKYLNKLIDDFFLKLFRTSGVMVGFNCQLGTTQNHPEEHLNEGLSILGWIVDMSMVDCLN